MGKNSKRDKSVFKNAYFALVETVKELLGSVFK